MAIDMAVNKCRQVDFTNKHARAILFVTRAVYYETRKRFKTQAIKDT